MGLDFVFLSHCVSTYVDYTGFFLQVPGVSVQVLCKFQDLQLIRVVDFSTTHPCYRHSRRNLWVLYQVYPCCRFFDNSSVLWISLQHGYKFHKFHDPPRWY